MSLIDLIGLLVFEKWIELSRIKCRCSFLQIEKYITLSKTSAILGIQKCIKSCGTGTIYNNRKQIKNVCFYPGSTGAVLVNKNLKAMSRWAV